MRYSVARTKARVEQKSYQIYVTDSLQNIPQSKYITNRWVDMLRQHEDIDVDAIVERIAAAIGDEDEPA